MGKNYLPALLEDIDASELPPFLGGSNPSPNGIPRVEKIPPELGASLAAAAEAPPPVAEPPVVMAVPVDVS